MDVELLFIQYRRASPQWSLIKGGWADCTPENNHRNWKYGLEYCLLVEARILGSTHFIFSNLKVIISISTNYT